MRHDFAVLTPEKTLVTIRLASLPTRVYAHLLDLTVWVLLVIAAQFFFGLLAVFQPFLAKMGTDFLLLFGIVTLFLYFILQEGLWNGQTIGKRAFHLRVVLADGTPAGFVAALGRNLLRPADMLPGPYLVGIIAVLTNVRSQRIGDLFANTIVVREQREPQRFTPAPHFVGEHQFERSVGDLRGMTIEEYVVLRRLCDRYYEMPGEVQARLMAEVWSPIARRRGVPQVPEVHPLFLAEAVVMKYGRSHSLL